MSWIVASQANPSALIRAPHMILAHKGFDGLLLELDAATSVVTAAVIFEDKATSNPRQTITKMSGRSLSYWKRETVKMC